ncbi:hypothetical protein AB0L65_33310 [Nonomuraea sp. NPDC052116]|uniref:hypothetical protein n=1 Tax=Nonomuraea sp. NPDC052116 TaxID=3155665 RepID=UPI00341CD1DC
MTTRSTSTANGSSVAWEQTGEEPNLVLPGSVPVGNLYCFGCHHSAQNARWSAATTHASNCTK